MTPPATPLVALGQIASDPETNRAVDDAMKKALAGDFAELNALELRILNLYARAGVLMIMERDGTPHPWMSPAWRELHAENAPFVACVLRGYGPEARQALRWELREKCRRCDGLLRATPDCRVCAGRWYVDSMEDAPTVITDYDGVVLEDFQ